MLRKRLASALLSCMLLFSCALVPAAAAEIPNREIVTPRASGKLNYVFSPGITLIGEKFSLDPDDKVTYDCTYTLRSASVDFGVIAPDGTFLFVNSTSGSIYNAFKVDQRGQYQLAIRNNASYAVTVTGTVKY